MRENILTFIFRERNFNQKFDCNIELRMITLHVESAVQVTQAIKINMYLNIK